ncbi:CRISPR-associated protein Cmr3 [Marichromatium bheemlicum]|uniref:CRISPR-associated protein Cmr3 n=1 Tax=Marichromatium bheemlicum TaxID=365339 RepID=A0ABX1IF05_9GAMM|nr:CRISPR-associated protein Cmr3 [Marichromatium bheemlicum]
MTKKKKSQGQGKRIRYDKQRSRSAVDRSTTRATPRGARARAVSVPVCRADPPSPSTLVTLDPLAPVIVRSGRPFDASNGLDEARFPPPSTLAGCLRTAWARQTGTDFGPALLDAVSVRGPLLWREGEGTAPDVAPALLVPKPADALYLAREGEREPCCIRAEPHAFEEGCGSDLPQGLVPVQLTDPIKGKPKPGPRWWTLAQLLDFRRGATLTFDALLEQGWTPATERRTHVAIDRKSHAAKTSQLFQTNGLDFMPDQPLDPAGQAPAATRRLRLLARCDQPLRAGLVHLGGERRLAALEPRPESQWPAVPEGWFEQMVKVGGLSLTLLTPAAFAAGFRPGWIDPDTLEGEPPEAPGVHLKLRAVACERWQANSGWDLHKGEPRPTRRLVAAGSVYWFELVGDHDPAAFESLWLSNISDAAQDRRDGFGLALPAPWTPCA